MCFYDTLVDTFSVTYLLERLPKVRLRLSRHLGHDLRPVDEEEERPCSIRFRQHVRRDQDNKGWDGGARKRGREMEIEMALSGRKQSREP